MNRMYLLPSAFLADQLAGDPEWFPHPVRLIGLATTHGERLLRRRDHSKRRDLITGTGLTTCLVSAAYLIAQGTIRFSYKRSDTLGACIEIFLAWTCLAARNLQQEAESVMAALAGDDLQLARVRLARIVGRDTMRLDHYEISRALIETVAESVSDGVIAPLFYMALGGVPLAMAYKAVNTLDSMIGYHDERYLCFGKAAARLDDLANYVPARLSALCIVALSLLSRSLSVRSAWETWLRDAGKHKSPNAGQPEAAMAGALRVSLGGSNSYAGELVPGRHLGEEFAAPTPSQALQAIRITVSVAWLGLAAGMIFTASRQRIKS